MNNGPIEQGTGTARGVRRTGARALPAGCLATGLFLLLPLGAGAAAASKSDLPPPQKREATVKMAEHLARPPAPAVVPADLPNPFNPPDFDKPDPEDLKAAAAAAAANPGAARSGPAAPGAPASDREVLETLAARIVPTGTINRGADTLLVIPKSPPFRVGTKFIVTYNGQDYELELTSIDRTTFTLRYRSEEVTRPIKPAK